ncbi:MAG: hypothetical protein MI723_02930, partial [Caulobacterales bacterium]|nr:hypothetical protein [Caulobacterales bacterium]
QPEENPFATPAIYAPADALLLSGYASEKRLEQVAGTPLAVAEREGGGAVILIADGPDFRGAFPSMNKLFLNAIFFSSLIEEPEGDYKFE